MDYPGTELKLFAGVRRWKAYWGGMVKPHIGAHVLEAGAGLGANIAALHRPRVRSWLCLEPDPGQAAFIRARTDLPACVEVLTGTLGDLPPDAAFDTILYLDVLEHIENDRAEMAAAFARLAPGGALVVFVPAHPLLFSPFDAAIGHYRRYSLRTLRSIMPPGAQPVLARHLDCAGALLSLANRFVLRSPSPTERQIRFWDRRVVPVSRVLDPLFVFKLGKNLLTIWRKEP